MQSASTDSQLVSVVIPVFNGQDTIAHALRSAFGQTHSQLEVIVVDDASTDRTRDVLEAVRDPRLRLIRHPANLGEGRSRNSAIAAATGEWIAMLDADDVWDLCRIEKLLALGRRHGEQFVLTDNIMHCYTAGDELVPWRRQWRATDLPFENGIVILDTTAYLKLGPLLVKPVIRRRPLLESGITHSSRIFGADTEFLIRLLKAGFGLLVAEEPLYLYRKTRGSMSDNPMRAAIMRGMFEDLLREIEFTPPEREAIEARLAALDREVRYLPFLAAVKSADVGAALRRGARDPWLVAEFCRRLPASVLYRLTVRLRGGQAR